jgi:hypothetical protein
MAVYTTVLAATASELDSAFPGWRKPLPKPVKKTRINPFTKKPQTYESWEPEDVVSDDLNKPGPGVVQIHGDYQTYLRERLPARLKTLPMLAAKGVLSTHVEQLLAAVAGRAEERLLPAMFPPGGSAATGKTLDVFPAWGIEALAELVDDALPSIGEQLATAEGWFADEGWTPRDCSSLLGELRRMALNAREGQRSLYLLTEA